MTTLAEEDIFPEQLALTSMLSKGAKWYTFTPPQWHVIAAPLTPQTARAVSQENRRGAADEVHAVIRAAENPKGETSQP